MATACVLLSRERFDWNFLVCYINAPSLVTDAPGTSRDSLLLRDDAGRTLL